MPPVTTKEQIWLQFLETQKQQYLENSRRVRLETWSKGAHTRCTPTCKISAPYLKRFQSYRQKCSFLTSFKTLESFQDPCSDCFQDPVLCYISNHSYTSCVRKEDTRTNLLSRPLRDRTGTVSAVKLLRNAKIGSFQDPCY